MKFIEQTRRVFMKGSLSIFLLAICILTCSALAQAQSGGVPGGIPGPLPPKPANANWQEFISPDASFSVTMPGKPTPQTQMTDTFVGRLQSHSFMLPNNGETYMVSYTDSPSGLDTPAAIKSGLDGMRDLGLSRISGKLISEKEIAYGQYPGRDITAEAAGGLFRVRHYVVSRRLYLLAVFTPSRLDDGKSAARFFESFKLLRQESENQRQSNDPTQAAHEELRQRARELFKQPSEARDFSSPEGRFSAWLPGELLKHSELANPADERTVVHTFMAKGNRLVCAVVYQDLLAAAKAPDEIKVLFDATRNQYIEAVKGKLAGETPVSLDGYPGREFKVELPSGRSIGKIYLVNQRFYLLWVIAPGQGDSADMTRFFDSFKLLQTLANEAGKPGSIPRENLPAGTVFSAPVELPATKPVLSVSSSVLEGNAIKKVSPVYPAGLKVTGTVEVRVLISEEGRVIEADVLNGHLLLRNAAFEAARQWMFRPTKDGGKPVKVEGILKFYFAP